MQTNNSTLTFKTGVSPAFYDELKKRIEPLLVKNKAKAILLTRIKTLLFPLLFVSVYVLLITQVQSQFLLYLLYVALGILTTLNVMNIAHDAVHGSLFKRKIFNVLAKHIIDIMGADNYAWYHRHVLFHHPYANVLHWDIDLEPRNLFKLSPVDENKRFHRYQHFYMPLIYMLFTLHWVFVQDFIDYFSSQSMLRQKTTVPRSAYLKMIIFKIIYITYILIIPIYLLPVSWVQVVLAFLTMHAIASIGVLVILMPNHWDEEVEFCTPDEKNQINADWAFHQLKNTNDFAIGNPFSDFLMGGLNNHVAHHLFPYVNHNHLPLITQEIRKICKERKLPYKSSSFLQTLRSHFRLLKNNGEQSYSLKKIYEAI